jgi:hypothetical protein
MRNVALLLLLISGVHSFQIRNTAIFDRGLNRDQIFINEPSLRKVASSNFMTGYDNELDSHFISGFGQDMMQLIVQAASLIPKRLNGEERYVYRRDYK